MLIQFFSNGTGGGAAPVGYLIADRVLAYDENRDLRRDRDGVPIMVTREPRPEVLRGDPARTEALIDACPHKWTYRAGVISFAREDAPNDFQQSNLIEQFEELAFAGLGHDQYDCLWVRHTHEDRIELHFCTPRMELSTGKSLNIAPPGYQKAFDSLRDLANKSHDWADPLDAARLREVRTQPEEKVRAHGREELHSWILDQISIGAIYDRASMPVSLREVGYELPRLSKDYLTVKDPETGERWRLKGEIFHDGWQAAAVERETEWRSRPDKERERRLDGVSIGELQERFERHREKRAAYNLGRYQSVPEMERDDLAAAKEYNPSRLDVPSLDAAKRELGDDFGIDWNDLALEQSDRTVTPKQELTRAWDADASRSERGIRHPRSGPNIDDEMQSAGKRSDLLSVEGVRDERSINPVGARIAGIRRDVEHLLQSISSGIARLRAALAGPSDAEAEWIIRLHDVAGSVAERISGRVSGIALGLQHISDFSRESKRNSQSIEIGRDETEERLKYAELNDDVWEL